MRILITVGLLTQLYMIEIYAAVNGLINGKVAEY